MAITTHPHATALVAVVLALCAAGCVGEDHPAFVPAGPSPASLRVDTKGLVDSLHQLAKISDATFPDVTRILFTDKDMEARAYVKGLMEEAGLKVREDAMGTIYGRYEGTDPSLPAVGTGSHTDAIPLSGLYDGCVGVLGAIEAMATLKRAGFKPARPMDVIMFTSEEPTRFGLSCLGSRAMAGTLTPERLDIALDENGTSFAEAAAKAGYGGGGSHADLLAATALSPQAYHSFVELHIEQGPLLEMNGVSIGVVTAVAAPAAFMVDFRGEGGHAGGQLMPYRNDAGLAAAELALAVEEAALMTGVNDTVATMGVLRLGPGAINSVPRDAHCEIDVRDIDGPRRDRVVARIIERAHDIAKKRKVKVSVEMINQDPPAPSGGKVITAVEVAADALSLSRMSMVSRAYHDTLFMARLCPTSMIFIPCKNGWSHRPDEYAAPSDIEAGVKTLALAMANLAMA